MTNLQQASGAREAQCERLTADVEGLRICRLGTNRKWVQGLGGETPSGQLEDSVRTERHGRVWSIVKMEHSEPQRR